MCTYTGTHMHMLPFGVSIDFSQHFRATSFIMTRHFHTYISLHLAFIHSPAISFSPLLLASALPQSLPLCFHGTYIPLSSLAPPLPLNLLLSQPSPWSPSLRLHEELHTTDWGQCLELSEDIPWLPTSPSVRAGHQPTSPVVMIFYKETPLINMATVWLGG